MKRWIVLLAAGLMCASSTGCLIPPNGWSADPAYRSLQLLALSEQLRQGNGDLANFLLINQMSNLNPIPGGAIAP
jgi:hypothetical protein